MAVADEDAHLTTAPPRRRSTASIAAAVVAAMSSDAATGSSDAEAASRLAQHGPNQTSEATTRAPSGRSR